ncbi:MAG TPA: hypothetical protein DDW94_12225 [Deltaproteobacteria bacterium]|nr:MAG: hypothetical protein A2Z79_08370 [Deltaproteobacteria bacterium GWA2_55_82]OGQ63135.1 MAG: hypothetical protein A3I81_10000 [Deltaproteobacteria bacterium RIFCSPLOWO2_02_FULL_55_12]OIJ73600.1 MAG: hypothetical protein A2V21_304565 [Deltaproteobacteria bacterium GWC2_55_46]HBG47735.1 hypothetical protein [Deltaproteobacteria bacterium]HCY12043.1 hypothetical protein [Deltaproteobacteria bacterium]
MSGEKGQGLFKSGAFFAPFYFCAVSLMAVIYTWPLVADIRGSFLGFPGDSLPGIWGLWWLDFSTSSGLPFTEVGMLAYPFGWDFSGAPLPYLFITIQYLSVKLFGDIAAFNLMKLASFPLLALTSYYLLFYVTRDRGASALFGAAYAFSPYHVIHTMAHFANLYWLPLALLFLLKSLREQGYSNTALFGLFWGLLTIDNAYFGFFVGLLIPVFLSFHLADLKKSGFRYCFNGAVVAGVAFSIVVLPMAWPAIKGMLAPSAGVAGVEPRRLSDLFIFSAKPLDYLLPSVHNPFLGWAVPHFGIGPLKGHRYTEHTLFIGYALLFLAGFAMYKAFKPDEKARQTIFLFLAAALIMLLISAPPFIPLGEFDIDAGSRTVSAEHKLFLPQYILFKVLPSVRVYARAGGVAMLAFTVLAAVGFSLFSRRFRSRKALIAAASVIMMIEFAEFPDFRITRPASPRVYAWLAVQPGEFAIAEYPFGGPDDPYTTYDYMFNQRTHGKPLVNSPAAGTLPDEFVSSIRTIDRTGAVEALNAAGVRYVVIHRDKYRHGNKFVILDWLAAPPPEKRYPPEWGAEPVAPKDLRLVMSADGDELYELPDASGLTGGESSVSLK